MQTPAVMMLELSKPLAPVAAHMSVATAPFVIPFMGFDSFNDYSRLFAKRANIERLLLKIEEISNSPSEKGVPTDDLPLKDA